MKYEFLRISENFDISADYSGKTATLIKETMPEVSSRARNPQANVDILTVHTGKSVALSDKMMPGVSSRGRNL